MDHSIKTNGVRETKEGSRKGEQLCCSIIFGIVVLLKRVFQQNFFCE